MERDQKSRENGTIDTFLNYSIADFIDLSLVEVLTLQFLLRQSVPVVRHTLYLEVSQFLQSESLSLDTIDTRKLSSSEKRYLQFLQNRKIISTSSFYNNLSNLEKRGLIKSNYNKKGKVETIEITNLTSPFLELVLQHFVRFGVRTLYPAMLIMKEAILEKLGKDRFENVLIVWLNDYIDIKLMRIVYDICDSMFILSKNNFIKDLANNGMKNVKFSSIYGEMIREPNKIFDLVFFPFYYRNTVLSGLTITDLLKEAVRVTKKNATVIITAQSKPSEVDCNLAGKVIEIYKSANEHTIYEISEIENDFKSAGISKSEIFDHKGDLIGIGWVG
ncbi:MAG: hypothetical protein ACFFCV_13055 [Promethearchaeota archaeon]